MPPITPEERERPVTAREAEHISQSVRQTIDAGLAERGLRYDWDTRQVKRLEDRGRPTNIDCLIADPYFGVFRETGCEDGDLNGGAAPSNASESAFQVWDAEGEVITQSLPWIDCCWIANALNTQSDAED